MECEDCGRLDEDEELFYDDNGNLLCDGCIFERMVVENESNGQARP